MVVLVGVGALVIILSVRRINSWFRASHGPGEAIVGGTLLAGVATALGLAIALAAVVAFPILAPAALFAIIAYGTRKRRKQTT